MTELEIKEAASHFGKQVISIVPLTEGLIHQTYKVEYAGSGPVVLQSINRNTFPHPENLIYNYLLLSEYLTNGGKTHIPAMVKADNGEWFWIDSSNNFWRATEFETGTVTMPQPESADDARLVAHCFGKFTRDLSQLDASRLKVIIPGFHDLSLRYNQFEAAVAGAHINRLLKSTHIIAELRQRAKFVQFYTSIVDDPGFKIRIMHHDCKMSNILLNASTRTVIGPIDLDTVMPGYYFSDIGDMIRSMAGTVDENSTRWEDVGIRRDFYEAIIEGYLAGTGDAFTKKEIENIHQAGLIMIYMQCLRFLTDFLNNDVYYYTTYPEQNLNRALNQLLLLERLEEFLEE